MCLSSRHQCQSHVLRAPRGRDTALPAPLTQCRHHQQHVQLAFLPLSVTQQKYSLKSSEKHSFVNRTMFANRVNIGKNNWEECLDAVCLLPFWEGSYPKLSQARVGDTLLRDVAVTSACGVRAHRHMKMISQWQYSTGPDADQQILLWSYEVPERNEILKAWFTGNSRFVCPALTSSRPEKHGSGGLMAWCQQMFIFKHFSNSGERSRTISLLKIRQVPQQFPGSSLHSSQVSSTGFAIALTKSLVITQKSHSTISLCHHPSAKTEYGKPQLGFFPCQKS